MEKERENWDRRYRQGSHGSLEPDPFLVESYRRFVAPLFPAGGEALDVAGGAGRHALWLAERGWRVTLLDISEAGVGKARHEAQRRGLDLRLCVCDLAAFVSPAARFDLVLVFFYLQRESFAALQSWLRPGGLLIYKTYTHEQARLAGGPTHPLHLLQENELLRSFPGLRVVYYRETMQERAVAEFVGQKK